MNTIQRFPGQATFRPLTPYETWAYFFKDMTNVYKIRTVIATMSIGGILILQSAAFAWDRVASGIVLGFVALIFFFIAKDALKKKKMQGAALAILLGAIVGVLISLIQLVSTNNASSFSFFPWLLPLAIGSCFLLFGLIKLATIKELIPPPTDQEFDAWVEMRAREGVMNTIQQLGLGDEIYNLDHLLCVRGFVLPGMKNARFYRPQDLMSNKGKDGRWRYSINIYAFFYPAEHQIMAFIYDINALNWADYREATKEYFYEDIIGTTTEDDNDTVYVNGAYHNYRTQRFSLRLCDGWHISATIRTQPLDTVADLPTFDVFNSGVDRTVAQLRMYLRSKKGGAT